ncbi:hypothetical protein [Embleya sp. NPDC001921]
MPTHKDSLSDEEFACYERELPGDLRAAVEAFPGPGPDLVARGLARGRQRRRARTLRRTALAVVLVLASVGGWAGIDGTFDTSSGPADRTGDPWVTGAPRDLIPFLAKAVPSGGGLADGVTRFDADAPRVLRTEASVSATYTNQSGSAALTVVLDRPLPGSRAEAEGSPDCAATSARDECTRSEVPGGGSLIVRRTTSTEQNVEQELRVVHTRPDGARVDVRLGGRYLAPGDVAGAPVLSVEQLTAAARSDAWKPVLAAIPTVAQQVTGLVTSLMPAGVQVTSVDGSATAGEFVVNTGNGAQGLTVSVEAGPREQQQPGCLGSGPEGGVCQLVSLSDGTSAVVYLDRTEDGRFVPWSLTAYRPHGLRIRFEKAVPPPLDEREDGRERLVEKIAASSRWDAF